MMRIVSAFLFTLSFVVEGSSISAPSSSTSLSSLGITASTTELNYLSGVTQAKTLSAKVIVHADTSTTALSGITTVVYSNEVTDSDSAYNPANGTFTVPTGKGGDYFVSGSWQTNAAETWVAGNQAVSFIQVNGTNKRISAQFPPGAGSMNVLVSIAAVVTVAAGDTIRIAGLGTPNPTLSGNAAQNTLDIIGPF